MSGLMATFNIAKSGMSVQQKAIDVTSHNIANANTEGYSRQRAIIETTRPFGMPSLNNAVGAGQLGTGSQVSAIQRVRDTFLDYQIRVETSIQGQFEARDKYLSEIENIFNEPSDTGLSSIMGKFFDGWQQLSKQPQSSNARTVVAQQSAALADTLNHTYTQLSKLKENAQAVINNSVFDVNNTLNQIDELNQQIMGVKIGGNSPNDLMDKRDLLMDQLSAKFNINIDKRNFEGDDIKPVDTGALSSDTACLVKAMNNQDVRRFSYIKSIAPSDPNAVPGTAGQYVITYCKNGDTSSSTKEATMTVNLTADEYKEMDECRVIWANSDGVSIKADGTENVDGAVVNYSDIALFKPSAGELKGYMTVQQDVDDYIEQVNKLAKALAFAVNTIHSANTSTNTTGEVSNDTMPFFVNSKTAKYNANNTMANLAGAGGILDTEKDIDASNISVNKEIMNDVMKMNAKTDTSSGETDGNRALAIAQLRDKLIKVQDMNEKIVNRDDLFDPAKGGNVLTNNGLEFVSNVNGTKLDNYFKDTIDRLGVQGQEAKRMVKNQFSLLAGLNESKEGNSGVSLDEEMASMIQFQRAYQANAKIISTVDELLDVVVNGLKR